MNESRGKFANLKSMIKVAAGGGTGVTLRYSIILLFDGVMAVPAAIMIANSLGCFILGYISGHPEWKTRHILLLGTGFAGGLTTFSNFAYDLFWLSSSQSAVVAILYASVSIITGLFFGILGYYRHEPAGRGKYSESADQDGSYQERQNTQNDRTHRKDTDKK
jgi:fluoride exporter